MRPGFAPILIIGFITSFLAVSGAVYFNQNKKVQVQDESTFPSQASTNEESADGKVSEWKSYTSDGLTFSYPSDTTLTKVQENKLELKPSFYQNNRLPSDNALYQKVFQIFVQEDPNSQNLTAQQLANNKIEELEKMDDSTVQAIAKKARSELKPYKIGDSEGVYTVIGEAHSIPYVYISKNNKIYTISFMGPEGDPAYSKTQLLIDQILSTFKFIN